MQEAPELFVLLPITIIDLGLSIVGDTLLLPFELFADNPDYGYESGGLG